MLYLSVFILEAQEETITLEISEAEGEIKISKYLHSVFIENLYDCIYDGIWVGKDSHIANIDGIRKDFVEGCIEAGVSAMRWPGGCFADHYDWKDGIGKDRKERMLSPDGQWPSLNDFGTDEFIHLCRLTNAEPIIVANVATGSATDFKDWFEYCNGSIKTKYGSIRAKNGHPDPYNVKIWTLGNTDENVWHIDYNNAEAYARDFLKFKTAIRLFADDVKLIGLGLSYRHNDPGWTNRFLAYITEKGHMPGPDALSIHHYMGGIKSDYRKSGKATGYSDEAYYYTLETVSGLQKDIDLHKRSIRSHVPQAHVNKTKICFDEWGLWHPEATSENRLHQPQTMRDAVFAALALHTFYRNADIVEFAMETQVANVLQSLFETEGEKFYETPTFYVFKLFKEHQDNVLLDISGFENNSCLDIVASQSKDDGKIVLSLVNKHLYNDISVSLPKSLLSGYKLLSASTIAPQNVRSTNTFEKPDNIRNIPLALKKNSVLLPEHSVSQIVFQKK